MPNEKRPNNERAERGSPASEKKGDEKDLVRLQRYLASAGLGSRRACEEIIIEGRVSVDGKVISDLGVRIDPRQVVRVDTEIVRPEPKRYYILNKPKGCVCTSRDPEGRTRAIDLVPNDGPRLFTVGRLDENSEGLILITNDGELAHRLAHPRFRVPRKYRAQVVGKPKPEIYEKLKKGLFFDDGKFRVRDVHRVGSRGNSTMLELMLTEGQNREIRRLLARVGHKVINLERIVFGPLRLGNLATGRFRALNGSELSALRDFAAGKRLPEFERAPHPKGHAAKRGGKTPRPSGPGKAVDRERTTGRERSSNSGRPAKDARSPRPPRKRTRRP